MGNNADERWLSRQELADRYGPPVKTLARWASKAPARVTHGWADTSDIISVT
jgi:hypothetical protein